MHKNGFAETFPSLFHEIYLPSMENFPCVNLPLEYFMQTCMLWNNHWILQNITEHIFVEISKTLKINTFQAVILTNISLLTLLVLCYVQ